MKKRYLFILLSILFISCKHQPKPLLVNDFMDLTNYRVEKHIFYLYDIIDNRFPEFWGKDTIKTIHQITIDLRNEVFHLRRKAIQSVANPNNTFLSDTIMIKDVKLIENVVPYDFYFTHDIAFHQIYKYEKQLKACLNTFSIKPVIMDGYTMDEIWGERYNEQEISLKDFEMKLQLTSYSFLTTIDNAFISILQVNGIFNEEENQLWAKYCSNCSSDSSSSVTSKGDK